MRGIRCAKRGVTRWLLFFVDSSSFCNPTPVVKSSPSRTPAYLAGGRKSAFDHVPGTDAAPRRQPPNPAERNRQQGSASEISPPVHFLIVALGAKPRWPSALGTPPP